MDRERMPQSTSHSMFKCFYVSRRVTMYFFFFFNDTATTEIYTLSLHDALPIAVRCERLCRETVDQHAAAGDSSEANQRGSRATRIAAPRRGRGPGAGRGPDSSTGAGTGDRRSQGHSGKTSAARNSANAGI